MDKGRPTTASSTLPLLPRRSHQPHPATAPEAFTQAPPCHCSRSVHTSPTLPLLPRRSHQPHPATAPEAFTPAPPCHCSRGVHTSPTLPLLSRRSHKPHPATAPEAFTPAPPCHCSRGVHTSPTLPRLSHKPKPATAPMALPAIFNFTMAHTLGQEFLSLASRPACIASHHPASRLAGQFWRRILSFKTRFATLWAHPPTMLNPSHHPMRRSWKAGKLDTWMDGWMDGERGRDGEYRVRARRKLL
eukprot:363876-Chlamydomonas_euryale.AAC.2